MTVGKVKDFSFPGHQGFTGSAGKVMVKPHMRGMPKPKMGPMKLPSVQGGGPLGPMEGPHQARGPVQVNSGLSPAESETTAGFKRGGKTHKKR